MSNYRGEELTLFIAYGDGAPSAEVARIMIALNDAVGEFFLQLGVKGVSLEIRDARMGSVKFWLGVIGVALPAAKLEVDHPGTLTRFLEVLRMGVVMSADATLPAFAKTFLGLCALPVAQGRADEVTVGSTEDDSVGISINGTNSITIVNNYYYGTGGTLESKIDPGSVSIGGGDAVQDVLNLEKLRGELALDGGSAEVHGDGWASAKPSPSPDAVGPDYERDNFSTGPIPQDDQGAIIMGPKAATIDWTLRDVSGRDVLIGLDLDVGERTGVIVGRHILERSIGRSDIGDAATTAEQKELFWQAVRRALVTDRPFHRTHFNGKGITAMRLEQDDFGHSELSP